MPTFTDKAGRSWLVELTVADLPRLRALGFELGQILSAPERMGDLFLADPEKLVAAVWLLCEAQADTAGVTPEQFAAGFDGPGLERSVEALIGAAIDFFPRSRVATEMRGRLTTALEQADRAIIEKMRSSAPATNSPASPA